MIASLMMIVITVWTTGHVGHGVKAMPRQLTYTMEKLYSPQECEEVANRIMQRYAPKQAHTTIECVPTDKRAA